MNPESRLTARLLVARLGTVLLLAATLISCAQHGGPQAGQRYAVLQTGDSRLAEAIFPVEIYNIDGKEQTVGFVDNNDLKRMRVDRPIRRITPGTHTIKARAIVDRSFVRGISRDLSRSRASSLTHHFVSGKRYFIGLKADGPRRADWKLVVWKEEDIKQGLIDSD